jgi:hypothetical protein
MRRSTCRSRECAPLAEPPSQRERQLHSPDIGIAEIPTPAIVFLDQAHLTHSYGHRHPRRVYAASKTRLIRCLAHAVSSCSCQHTVIEDWCREARNAMRAEAFAGIGASVARSLARANACDAGHRASGYLLTKRGYAPSSPYNGLEVHLRGQGLCGYGSAARGLPACESRDAGGAPPFMF